MKGTAINRSPKNTNAHPMSCGASAPFEPSRKPSEPTIIKNPNPNPANPSDERLTTPRTRPNPTDLGGFGWCSVTRARNSCTRISNLPLILDELRSHLAELGNELVEVAQTVEQLQRTA